MLFKIFLCLSAAVFLLSFLGAAISAPLFRRRRWGLPSYYLLIIGTLVSLTLYFFPLSYVILGRGKSLSQVCVAVLSALHSGIRLFAIDGDYLATMTDLTNYLSLELVLPYRLFGVVLHIFAPLLTFGFILSFVKNFSSLLRYRFAIGRAAHIFSELNEESLSLARSIVEEDRRRHFFLPRAVIVFTDVMDTQEESQYDLITASDELGAILFRKDLEGVRFRLPFSHKPLNFYLIEKDESEKLRHAAAIMRDYDKRGVMLYVFSSSTRSELLLSTKSLAEQKVVRVNDIQSLVYHNLDLHGMRLFHHARLHNDSEISVVIVGFGKYGQEMLKALSWYGQVPGFRLRVTVLEKEKEAEQRFRQKCPEMLARSGVDEEGEAYYDIAIKGGIDVKSADFLDKLREVGPITHVFVSLGDDESNIATALAIRSFFEREYPTFKPDVQTVVYDSAVARTMGMTWTDDVTAEEADGVRIKKHACRIHTIGDLESFYSVETVLDSALVEAGLRVHLRYCTTEEDSVRALDLAARFAAEGKPKYSGLDREARRRERLLRRDVRREVARLEREYGASFWLQEYNYRSSIAKALAERLRAKLLAADYITLPGIDKPWGERTEEEKLAIGRFEHIRWNAYVRSEGYQRGERNDLAKLHHLLRPLSELGEDEVRKDA